MTRAEIDDAACSMVPASSGGGYLLREPGSLADVACRAIETARALGYSQARALARESAGLSIQARDGAVAAATRNGEQRLTVTVYDRGRTGRATTQALDDQALRHAVERAATIAGLVEPDEAAGLADPALLARNTPAVPLFAPSGLSAQALGDTALAIEAAVLAQGGGAALRVTEASAASLDQHWALATSQGFLRTGSASHQQRGCGVIAERGGTMTRDGCFSSDRRVDRLLSADAIGSRAARRALDKHGARNMPGGVLPVLLDAPIAASLVEEACGALTGMRQFQRMTILPDAIGKDLLAAHLDIVEDPFEPYGLASATHDSEGVAGSRRAIVEGGIVAGLFLDSAWARRLGRQSTGNADSFANLSLTSRETGAGDDLASLFARMGRGLWVTELLGGNVNPISGDYSKAAAGFLIEEGAIAGPVHNLTIAGTLPRMLRDIVAVGTDVHRSGAIRTGSILIDGLHVAGR